MNADDLRIAAERVGLRLETYSDGYALCEAGSGLSLHRCWKRITAADVEWFIGREPAYQAESKELDRLFFGERGEPRDDPVLKRIDDWSAPEVEQ